MLFYDLVRLWGVAWWSTTPWFDWWKVERHISPITFTSNLVGFTEFCWWIMSNACILTVTAFFLFPLLWTFLPHKDGGIGRGLISQVFIKRTHASFHATTPNPVLSFSVYTLHCTQTGTVLSDHIAWHLCVSWVMLSTQDNYRCRWYITNKFKLCELTV